MTESSVHEIFETEAADRDLPSPYMEKYFAKFEGLNFLFLFCSLNNTLFWWPKSNVSKVRAYCSASDHLIRKIFSGVCRGSHWFEEYLKIIEISDNFFE